MKNEALEKSDSNVARNVNDVNKRRVQVATKRKIHSFFEPFVKKMKKNEQNLVDPQPSTSKDGMENKEKPLELDLSTSNNEGKVLENGHPEG